jgi:ribosome-associated protein
LKADELKVLTHKSLDDLKGQNIVCLDVKELTSVCDYMYVVTGTSNRHLKALTDELVKKVKQSGAKVYGMEGQNQSEWILIDLGDVIVHAMLASSRELYDLESLWSITAERAENEN